MLSFNNSSNLCSCRVCQCSIKDINSNRCLLNTSPSIPPNRTSSIKRLSLQLNIFPSLLKQIRNKRRSSLQKRKRKLRNPKNSSRDPPTIKSDSKNYCRLAMPGSMVSLFKWNRRVKTTYLIKQHWWSRTSRLNSHKRHWWSWSTINSKVCTTIFIFQWTWKLNAPLDSHSSILSIPFSSYSFTSFSRRLNGHQSCLIVSPTNNVSWYTQMFRA